MNKDKLQIGDLVTFIAEAGEHCNGVGLVVRTINRLQWAEVYWFKLGGTGHHFLKGLIKLEIPNE